MSIAKESESIGKGKIGLFQNTFSKSVAASGQEPVLPYVMLIKMISGLHESEQVLSWNIYAFTSTWM